jgi:hypothetical protein
MPFSLDVVPDFLIPSARRRLSATMPPLRAPLSWNARRRASLTLLGPHSLLDAGQLFVAS